MPAASPENGSDQLKEIASPLEGKFYLTKESNEQPVKIGDRVAPGDTIAYIEAMKVYNAIAADQAGTVVEILYHPGDEVEEDDVLIRLK